MAAPDMRDVRALVRDFLGCKSVYSSTNSTEVRCLVEQANGASTGRVHEWLIRLLPRDEYAQHANPAMDPALVNDENSHHRVNRGIEEKLDEVLRLWGPLRSAKSSETRVNEASVQHESTILEVLYTEIPRYTSRQPRHEILHGLFSKTATPHSACAAILRGILETDDGQRLAVYDYEQQSLHHLLKFNRFLLDDEEVPDASLADMKRRFLVYQLWQLVSCLDNHGMVCPNGLAPSQIWLADNLYVRLGSTPVWSRDADRRNEIEEPIRLALSVEEVTQSSPTERWTRGDMSNFDYLMMLNAAAGRRMIDGVFHPVLPWVTDFSTHFGGWRDLTKTKFRLNKGDNQLDRTYESSVVPHHITESLSEITYYIYMARRTPMAVLRKVVRRNFQPKEYPATMARLFQWTPDECIPEFYTDAGVFASIHGEDVIAPMALPTWCQDAVDFVRSHRAMLESDHVSRVLHQWIDLNFGVCLSGEAAVQHKNVPLKIRHGGGGNSRKSPGFVQIFDTPHPQRYSRASHENGSSETSSPSMQGLNLEQRPADGTAANMHASLRSAIRIADDARVCDSLPLSATTTEYPSFTQPRHGFPSPPGSSSDKKSTSMTSSFVKLKKRPKSKQKVHTPPGESQPGSPPAQQRSPTVARFTHAIPKFFGAESPRHPSPSASVGHTGAQGAAGSVSLGPASGNNLDRSHHVPQHAATMAHSLPPGMATTPTTVSSPGTHIFRDLWHQISKADDDDSAEATDEGRSFFSEPLDCVDADFDALDDTSLLLLQAGPAIRLPLEDESCSSSEQRPVYPLSVSAASESVILAPVCMPPRVWNTRAAEDAELGANDIATSDFVFSFGCTIAEIYTGTPLFSAASLDEYCRSYWEEANTTASSTGSSSPEWRGRFTLETRLSVVPFDMKNLIFDLLHPDQRYRVSAWRSRSAGASSSLPSVAVADAYLPSDQPLFPVGFKAIYRFLDDFHHATAWNDRFRVSRSHLSVLTRLPDNQLCVVLPVLTSFFKAGSHIESINVIQVCAAIVYLLSDLATRLGTAAAVKRELLDDTLRLYESSELSPVLKLSLCTPDVIKSLVTAFGAATVLRHFFPVVVDWLSSPPAYQRKKTKGTSPTVGNHQSTSRPVVLFSAEATSMLAVACGELASSDLLGASMAIKYILPALLPKLGKVLPKWSRLTEAKYLIRQDSRPVSGTEIGNRAAYGGKNGDGIHVAYAPKQVLYETHSVADAILLVCRELPASTVSASLLPHLCDVVPRIVDVAESVSSAQIAGIPDDLAREVYVTLRVLRHVVRSLSEQAVQKEFLQQRASFLIDLLNRMQPPFLHPRTADAVMSSMSDTIKSKSDRPVLFRHNSTPTPPPAITTSSAATMATAPAPATAATAATRQSRLLVDRLLTLQGQHAQDLRAFTAVGVARTITSALQKVGPEAAATASGIIQSINAFLVRCAAIYSELEVSDFQWRMASEVVSEFCSPLRALFGATSFGKLFPIVQASSVLQLLLLPSDATTATTTNDTRTGAATHTQSAKPYLRRTSTVITTPDSDETNIEDYDASPRHDDTVKMLVTSMPELLHTAYRAARLNGIKTASFLHVSLRSGSTWSYDLNEEIFLVQEERKKRRAMGTANRAGGETAWLRPRWRTPFAARNETESVVKASPDDTTSAVAMLGTSWPLRGEIRHSMRAHSSMMRFISVDLAEEIVITASKNGSCRAWRLGGYPGQACGAIHIDSSTVMSACHLEDGRQRAVALTPTSVHVWDIRTSQVFAKIPFTEETLTSCTPLRVLPYRHYLDFAPLSPSSSTPSSSSSCSPVSREFSVGQGNADFVASSPRKLFLVDVRAATRVVADWRVDAHDAAWITTTALISTPSRAGGVIASGTASGQILLVDKRMGQLLTQWHALEGSRVVKIVQYSPSYLLVVGSDREARVWQLRNTDNVGMTMTPTLRMVVTHLPEGVRDTQVTLQAYADAVLLYVASSTKLLCTRLIHEGSAEAKRSEILTARMESWILLDNMGGTNGATTSSTNTTTSGGGSSSTTTSGDRAVAGAITSMLISSPERGRLHRTKVSVQSVAVLPLRQVVLLGGDDGSLRTCV